MAVASATIIRRRKEGGVSYTLRLRILTDRSYFDFPLTAEEALTLEARGVEVFDG